MHLFFTIITFITFNFLFYKMTLNTVCTMFFNYRRPLKCTRINLLHSKCTRINLMHSKCTRINLLLFLCYWYETLNEKFLPTDSWTRYTWVTMAGPQLTNNCLVILRPKQTSYMNLDWPPEKGHEEEEEDKYLQLLLGFPHTPRAKIRAKHWPTGVKRNNRLTGLADWSQITEKTSIWSMTLQAPKIQLQALEF